MSAAALAYALEGLRIPPRGAGFTLAELSLEVLIQEAARPVREETANFSARIRRYWLTIEPPVDILHLHPRPPWCAVPIQYAWDVAARLLGCPNPLDAVRREAYVEDYYALSAERGWLIPAHEARAGDLVFYRWHGGRHDHIGEVQAGPGHESVFFTVEGNTPPADAGDQRGASREPMDGLYPKRRRMTVGSPEFARPSVAMERAA